MARRITSDLQLDVCTPAQYYDLIALFENAGTPVMDVRPFDKSGTCYAHVDGISIYAAVHNGDELALIERRLIEIGVSEENLDMFLPEYDREIPAMSLGDFVHCHERICLAPTWYNVQAVAAIVGPCYRPLPGDPYPRVSCLLRGFEGVLNDLGDFLNTPQHLREYGIVELLRACLKSSNNSRRLLSSPIR